MELSTSITISAHVHHRSLASFTFNAPFLSRKMTLPLKQSPFHRTNRGLLYGSNMIVRRAYEGGSTDSTNYATEIGSIKLADDEPEPAQQEDLPLGEVGNIKMEDDEPAKNELPKEDSSFNGQVQTLEFIDKLDIKWDSETSVYSSLLLGGGALVGLWLATAMVGAVDSIPLLPKFLEIVGLAYTIWFSTRYLIFKETRKELTSKIEEIKKQVI